MNDFEGNASEAGQTLSELGASKGGKARAKSLTKEQRSEIARKAAEARWDSKVPRATHTGDLKIGDISIPCAVLEDGTRVLWQQGFLRAIGRTGRAAAKAMPSSADNTSLALPVFLRADNLKPFINNDLIKASTPIVYRPIISSRGGKSIGYEAELLSLTCGVFLDAAEADELRPNQLHIYKRCKILMRGFAMLGITALIDEATGYQEVRDRQALQAILDKFLRKELAAWASCFPNEFYQELFRLRGWDWRSKSSKRPRQAGKDTKNIVYSRLAPGILDELERKNPPNENWHRKARHHQWLTEDIGHPALAQHLHAVMALMRVSKDWDNFKLMLDRAFPKRGDTMQLPLMVEATSS